MQPPLNFKGVFFWNLAHCVYDHQGFDVGKNNFFFFANNYFISVHISLICDHINRRIILALKFQLVEQYELYKITSSRTIIYFRNQALLWYLKYKGSVFFNTVIFP